MFQNRKKCGTLVGLVMEFDNCSFEEAIDILDGGCTLREMEKRLDEMIANRQAGQKKPELLPNKLNLPERSFLILSMPEISIQRMSAVSYLEKRQIPIDGFYYCTSGNYQDRIIIPYYDQDGRLIYFNSRYIGSNSKALRYLGPPKEIGLGKGDVLYMHVWPKEGSKVYLTEGEFDARTLNLCGLYGVACGGRYMTKKQIDMLKSYEICMAFDADAAGEAAQQGDHHVNYNELKWLASDTFPIHMDNPLTRHASEQSHYFGCRKNLTFVRPPTIYKDWNKMMCVVGIDMVKMYIEKCEQPFGTVLKKLCEKSIY